MKSTVAFSVPHDKLQETIGLIIVSKNGTNLITNANANANANASIHSSNNNTGAFFSYAGYPRTSLKSLHKYISDKLQPAKWPQLIVFMDDIVKTQTNKVQRIGLSARMVRWSVCAGVAGWGCVVMLMDSL